MFLKKLFRILSDSRLYTESTGTERLYFENDNAKSFEKKIMRSKRTREKAKIYFQVRNSIASGLDYL